MSKERHDTPAEPFFLTAGSGQRFCLYHDPPPSTRCRGAFVYVHPFGEEMNKSRRMAAMQARAFAAAGYGVLQVDLLGCGDSSGEFGDARWDIWKNDVALAVEWLDRKGIAPVGLWGLRLGALLALDFAKSSGRIFDTILLWQPIASGATFLTQLLRMRIAGGMLAGPNDRSAGTQAMRSTLAAGEALEVGGYELAPQLASAIDSIRMEDLVVTTCPVHWLEIVPESGHAVSPASRRIADDWTRNGVDLHLQAVSCLPFWATQEISECPALLSATTEALCSVAES